MMQRPAINCRPDLIDSSFQITIVAEVVREEDLDEKQQAMVSFLKLWEAFENQSDVIQFQAYTMFED